ncbi:3-hydroxyisobutyryl-CoA hydrolase 1-like [Nymphaea colorata]|nr:3-hydroxyisobutyryl-CoA hydrolase 1-like [Nymphaea colorata]
MATKKWMDSENEQVLVEQHNCARTIVLNRPRQLNALSFKMVSRLLQLFLEFEEDSKAKLLIMKGKGRAFSAGGDVSAAAHLATEGHWSFAAKFFQVEYTLNYVMATYSKPQVSLLDGIVMGGGAGASMHGRFRVVTENTVFAMPETALGLFPDVGASHFLSRLPGFFGEYVGLTGVRLSGADLLACGLATHFVPSMKIPLLEEALHVADTSDPLVVNAIILKLSERIPLKDSSPYHRLDIINKCFSKRSVEEIMSALEEETLKGVNEWLSVTIESLKKASPLSLKLCLRLIREGRLQSIDQCLSREYRVVSHIMKSEHSSDFFEGCRAILFDKDRNPKWNPSKLELVSEEMVDDYLTKVNDEEWKDLELLPRPRATASSISKL